MIKDVCSSENIRIVYACAGCADVGELADRVSRKLRKEGFATPQASCLAGIGAGIEGFISFASKAHTIIAIDGCGVGCTRLMLAKAGLKAQTEVLTEYGIEKGKTVITDELIDKMGQFIKDKY